MFDFLTKLFGSRNERILKQMYPVVEQINAMESRMQLLSDDELKAKTAEFKARLADGETVDALLPEAFAVAREASVRCLGMRHFDVQLIGGMILNNGMISEMKTGEGKTLMATLPVYLNALTGRGVHVVTVNDYLAKRDAEWMGRLYAFLGLSTGVIVHGISSEERKNAYASDITYGTNNEFGFDYLRDNMAFAREDLVQREQHYAIVDEVDSILIDEARTPLIISGPAEKAGDLYMKADAIIKQLDAADYEKDEKDKAVSLTEEGMEHVETLLREGGLMPTGNLYDPENVNLMHAITQCLRANTLFTREVDYIVRNDEVIIIDEFTGRMMPGRRYSDGQHQALEAKEGVTVQPENQTLASVTFQNYFRMYEKLAGMTGTADTEAEEFEKIYKLEVVIVPTNNPMIRDDKADLIFGDQEDKYIAVIEDIVSSHKSGQPILVGTTSIEKSEFLSGVLTKRGIKHEVLNAKQHEREAEIVAQAGRKGAVTIATNMAGRGTDIMLGGNPDMLISQLPGKLSEDERKEKIAEIKAQCAAEHIEVVAAGGLHIVGTERHESRRIDNQLRGRAGRQGDPGSTRFYLSLQDDLMRIFGGEKMQAMLTKMGFNKGESIEHPWVTKAIENSQKKVEGRNFDIRKQLLEYDDVMNQQRDVVYSQRRELLEADDVRDVIEDMRRDFVATMVDRHMPAHAYADDWALDALHDELQQQLTLDAPVKSWVESDEVQDAGVMVERICSALAEMMQTKEERVGVEAMHNFEKYLVLQMLDHHWKDHLLAMDHLRQSVGLRGYAQKQPLQEYKRESFELFAAMLGRVRMETMLALHQVRVEQPVPVEEPKKQEAPVQYSHGAEPVDDADHDTFKRDHPKVGRNDPCPCGSGKKYKQCHGAR
ncbi:MAG: preprotein translocase subunit SecA [Zetaproteobacteria bacterium CG06_land_8_20_14_3_00_59_53]|nr:MAG: preprotein translocase subunit SecA [Zetaproteobacteria bacterium CG2_30_59_37]PIO89562.1 MAG: preprotein translocase subunit SecA [Zetaproteobacteria bacterium CG23_combo_of_CG06-09_8_20_14_all_59_86]PIQ65794.1 MAG: preprotein translocase subunit SecA [Zetaproteobacteria bacterium CG11_big_fil_rev_8_21_14_0_20_59_439]PIU70945.1 MAG: preprotein translocase subunit SecA [Zetaproteobacteria bacterium CG06_land_8_20_14_3_00_59_53]PIU97098.1 MAG: preprotein translocase subunit SecA [Zetapro